MLPPLQPYPTSAQYYSQQPFTQPWPGSSTAPGKPGGAAPFPGPPLLNPPFGSIFSSSGAGNSNYSNVGAAASLPGPATASGWPAGTVGGTTSTGRGRGGSFSPGSRSASQRQSPDSVGREGPDRDWDRDLLPDGGTGDQGGGGGREGDGAALDPEQDPDPEQGQPPNPDDPEQPQEPQQQQQPAASSNPYLQLLSQAGVGVGGLSPYGGSLAAAAQAAHEVQQAALRKRVQRDIRRMLAGNRAYQHHVKGPPAMSAESLASLAQPKLRPGSLPDSQAVANLPDPVDWARWKTDQLVISRLQGERRQAEREEEKRRAEEQLAVYRQHKTEAKQAQAEAKARAAAEEAAYRANMSAFLNHKGKLDLEDFRSRREEQSERLSLMRSRQVKSLSAHHY